MSMRTISMRTISIVGSAKDWVRRQGWLAGSVTSTRGSGVVVTLDDGPDPVETPKVLSVLRRHHASATFFVLLSRVRLHGDLLGQILEEGHEVGLHGVDHQPLTRFDFRSAVARTRDAKNELEDTTGRPIRWFRPPYGAQTPATWLATRAAGLTPVLWSGTTWDWKDVPSQVRFAKATEAAHPGAILLAHDGIASLADGGEDEYPVLVERAALLDEVLRHFACEGLPCRSLGVQLGNAQAVRTVAFTALRRPLEKGASLETI